MSVRSAKCVRDSFYSEKDQKILEAGRGKGLRFGNLYGLRWS